MNNQLLTIVQANAAHQPTWLQQKRSLALMMQNRLQSVPEQPEWIQNWQNPRLLTESEPSYQLHLGNDYVLLPFQKAALQYSELLQENLMEKAVRWQANQLNAMHLALIDAGQFMYVPDHHHLATPFQLRLITNSQNPHNLIIVGAGAHVTIEDDEECQNTDATYLATELLVGTGAHVHYCQRSTFNTDRVRHAVHVYQARQSRVQLSVQVPSNALTRSSFYSFLDGNESHCQVNLLAQAGHQQDIAAQVQVDGYGTQTSAENNAWGWCDAGSHLQFSKLTTVDDEPLTLRQHQVVAGPQAVLINDQEQGTVHYRDAPSFFHQSAINDPWLRRLVH